MFKECAIFVAVVKAAILYYLNPTVIVFKLVDQHGFLPYNWLFQINPTCIFFLKGSWCFSFSIVGWTMIGAGGSGSFAFWKSMVNILGFLQLSFCWITFVLKWINEAIVFPIFPTYLHYSFVGLRSIADTRIGHVKLHYSDCSAKNPALLSLIVNPSYPYSTWPSNSSFFESKL